MANLVVCCDGTWNTPDDTDGGMPAPTNVRRLFNALADKDDSGTAQKKYYHPGVGTSGRWWKRIAGGGGGAGLADNVKSAYQWLAYNYRPGDNIFLFGFSSGAFTVRSLSGMIDCCGLLDITESDLTPDEAWRRIDLAFRCYRLSGDCRKSRNELLLKEKEQKFGELKALEFHNVSTGNDPHGTTPIFFLGVWDTVGALGIPNEFALLNLLDNPKRFSFHNATLCPTVLNARHAVALDEKRRQFAPTLWPKDADPDRVKQVWFPGVHSDVGGGYAHVGLSDGALKWMMDEAASKGLNFQDDLVKQLKVDHWGVLHNSLTGVFKILKSYPRNIPKLSDKCEDGPFHESVCERYKTSPIAQGAYWPTENLVVNETHAPIDIYARDKWNFTGLCLEENAKYRLTASGQWVDWFIKCGPAGVENDSFDVRRIGYAIGSAIGHLQTLFRSVTKNKQATFLWAKREQDMPWFALVGVVANGGVVDEDGDPAPHQAFLIGEGCTIEIKPGKPGKSGYLYCFANDAWGLYFNNKGHVALTVEKLS